MVQPEVSSLDLPAQLYPNIIASTHVDGTTFYEIQVTEERKVDAMETSSREWKVWKRYSDFRGLEMELRTLRGYKRLELPTKGLFGFRRKFNIGSFRHDRECGLKLYLTTLTERIRDEKKLDEFSFLRDFLSNSTPLPDKFERGSSISKRGVQLTKKGERVGATKWGMTIRQVREFYEKCRDDIDFDDNMDVREFAQKIIRKHFKDGRGVALTYNDDEPLLVNTLVCHSWSENANQFFLDLFNGFKTTKQLRVKVNKSPEKKRGPSSFSKDSKQEKETDEEEMQEVDHDDLVVFICFLSVYQGSDAEISMQVKQGYDDVVQGCFPQVLQSVANQKGEMLVIANEELKEAGQGLYSRLWCVWEVFSAIEVGMKVRFHEDRRTEQHLFGKIGCTDFDAEKARCGEPGTTLPNSDEKSIREVATRGPGGWTKIGEVLRLAFQA